MSIIGLHAEKSEPLRRSEHADTGALIVVIRTPKSASTSLAAIAADAFAGTRSFFLPNTLDIEGSISALQHVRHIRHTARLNYRWHRRLRLSHVFDRIAAQAKAGDIITGGHIDFETCRRNLSLPLKFVTLVRHPVDRSLSEYAYARAGYARKRGLAKIDASLVAKAAGRYSFEGYLDFLLDHRAAFADIACRHIGLLPTDDIATHFAANAFHFGSVDNLSAFARTLSARTGRDVNEHHLNQTASPARLKLSPGERCKIENLYAGDLALYEWVRAHEAQLPQRPQGRPTLNLVSAHA
jgi:hypothetical protein